MAVIYSYPQVSAVDGTELLICSQTSSNNATRSMTTAAFGAYISAAYGPGGSIYLANGTLAGDRTLVGAANYLHFNSLSNFTVGTSADINLDPGGEVAVGAGKSISFDQTALGANVTAIECRSNPRTQIAFVASGPGDTPNELWINADTDLYLAPDSGNTIFNKNLAFYTASGGLIADINTASGKVLVSKEWVATTYPGTVTSILTTGTVNGLTLTGGPITGTGSVSLGGTLAINDSDWSGTDLSASNGGTGISNYFLNDILYADSASTLNRLPIGSPMQVLTAGMGGLTWTTPASSNIIDTGNTLWVDAVNGNNVTALPDRQDLQYLTIAAAITASIVGDTIKVRPGAYAEEGLTITGRSLISEGGWGVTEIGPASASATTDIITLGVNGYIQGFSINVPQIASSAILADHNTGTNSIYDIVLLGDSGGASLGTGIKRTSSTGNGKTIGGNIRVEEGGMTNVLLNDSGALALEGIHVPDSTGTTVNVLQVTTLGAFNGRSQIIGFNTGSTSVTNAVNINGGSAGIIPTALIFTPNIFNCTNAIIVDGVYLTVNLLGGRIENVTYAINVPLAATTPGTASATYRVTSNHQPNYRYGPSSAANSDFSLVYSQETSDTRDSSFNIFGPDQLSAGVTEKGIEASFGRGAPYTNGMVVLTTNSTATDILDGGNITDISSTAGNKSGTFQFQGTAANHTILIGSVRKDELGNALKFYGLDTIIDTGDTTGTYSFEIWAPTISIPAGQWVTITAMCTSQLEGYPYGQSYFLRDDSSEFHRFGIDNTYGYSSTGDFEFEKLTWDGTKTIAGVTSYWVRIRKTNGLGNPTFQRFKLMDSSFNISKNGVPSGTGLGMFRKTISLSGRIWSGTIAGMGSLGDYSPFGGVGDSTGDVFAFEINKSEMSSGQETNVTFPIPIGTCTAFPIKIKCVFNFQGGTDTLTINNHVITASALPQAGSGNLVADSLGGTTLVRRDFTDADLLLAAGSRNPNVTPLTIDGSNNIIEGAVAGTTWASLENMVHEIELCEVDISDYYENDLILLNIFYNTGNSAVTPFSLIVEGVFHQDGAGI